MNLNLFLAKRIGGKADATGKLSRMGSVISIASVAVSVCVIIIATAVSDGFRRELREKARGYSSDLILAAPGEEITSTNHPVTSDLSYKGKLVEIPGIESVSGVSYTQGILKTNDEIGGIILKGVDSTYNLNFYNRHLVQGTLPNFSGKRASDEIMMSKRLANTLQYKVGDKVTAWFIGEQVRVRRFHLTGIFDAQLEELDKHLAIGDIRQVNRINGWDNKISGYEISVGKNTSKEDIGQAIEQAIFKYQTDDDPSVAVTTLEEKYYILYDWLNLLDLNVLIILALMMAVAGFNMVSALLIMLFERISQIGLLKALGMGNAAVAKIFLTKSALVALQGMAIGNALAIALCLLQQHLGIISLNPDNYFVSAVPISLEAYSIILMNIIAFSAIMTIMLLPCLFITGINPATTMRVK